MIKVTVGEIKPDLNKVFDGAIDLLYGVIRVEAIAALQAPVGVSKWPVQTG